MAVAHGRVDVQDAAKSIEELSSGLTVRHFTKPCTSLQPRTYARTCASAPRTRPSPLPVRLQALQPSKPQTRILDAPGRHAAQLAHGLEEVALVQHTAAARGVTPDSYAAVRNVLPGVQYHAGAEMLLFHDAGADVPKPPRLPGRVAIVCGSTTDLRAAYEAKLAVGLMGGYATIHQDVSAAELTGVVRARAAVAGADAVIVCCGEQPALAGLLGGMVAVPVIAIPGVGAMDPTSAMCVAGTGRRRCSGSCCLGHLRWWRYVPLRFMQRLYAALLHDTPGS